MAANRYAAGAKAEFLVEPALLDDPAGRLVIAVRSAQHDERVTPLHQHARGQLFGATKGLITVGTPGGQWVVPAIHAVWVPPHQPHSLRSHGPFEGWSVYVAESECTTLPASPRTLHASRLLDAAIDRAVSWSGPVLGPEQVNLSRVILDEIRSSSPEDFGLPSPRDPRLLRITGQLAENPQDDRDLDAWAAHAGLSARSISRRFVAETGFTFTEWRQRARLLRALELLAAQRSVTEVALQLGYGTVSAFIALFKRTFGTTPARFFGPRADAERVQRMGR